MPTIALRLRQVSIRAAARRQVIAGTAVVPLTPPPVPASADEIAFPADPGTGRGRRFFLTPHRSEGEVASAPPPRWPSPDFHAATKEWA